MSGEQLWRLIQGLQDNDLLHYTHLLTGYIGSVSFLETIVKIIKALRDINPNLVYCMVQAAEVWLLLEGG